MKPEQKFRRDPGGGREDVAYYSTIGGGGTSASGNEYETVGDGSLIYAGGEEEEAASVRRSVPPPTAGGGRPISFNGNTLFNFHIFLQFSQIVRIWSLSGLLIIGLPERFFIRFSKPTEVTYFRARIRTPAPLECKLIFWTGIFTLMLSTAGA